MTYTEEDRLNHMAELNPLLPALIEKYEMELDFRKELHLYENSI
jgi:hypothetical protein